MLIFLADLIKPLIFLAWGTDVLQTLHSGAGWMTIFIYAIKNNFNIKKWLRAGNNFGFAYNNNSSRSCG